MTQFGNTFALYMCWSSKLCNHVRLISVTNMFQFCSGHVPFVSMCAAD